MGKVVTFASGGTMPDASDFDSILASGWWQKAKGSVDAWASRGGDGSLHRFGAIAKVSNDETEHVRLDTKEDWRDRLVVVHYAVGVPTDPSGFSDGFSSGFGSETGIQNAPAWPGLNEQISFVQDPGSQMWVTGTGHIPPQATKPSFGIQLAPGLFLYCDISGHLVLNGNSSLDQQSVGVILILHAHDQLGVELTPDNLHDPSVSDGTKIAPGELNTLQDAALMEQFNAWDPPIDPSDGTAVPTPESMPLGPKVKGENPGIPDYWEPRRRNGIVDAPQTWHRRQVMAGGGRKRVQARAVTDASTEILDSSEDWRDRIIHIVGRFDTANFLAGDTNDGFYNVKDQINQTFYSWVGKDAASAPADNRHQATVTGSLVVYVDEDNGNLVIRNDTGSTYYVSFMVEASPQLGPRTARTE